ncbi:hypothetical protein [Streptomyces sp. NBC_01176]|uniref:hypothetical protein n=1 Tax=Streptomyces sp. NBC_01176 TaxID=2903760 RepID=UPI003867CBF4|nr:hypothetical protein OG199_08140 [Streptomyces sp. NBC_01176]
MRQDDGRDHGMGYKNEDEIKRALGIESWRHLSKEKMIRFVAMMPDMSTEVALKIIEQFPAFKDFAKDVVGVMEKAYESTLSANKQSQEHSHRSCQEVREILRVELSKDNLSGEDKKFIIEQIQETLRMEFQKDSENKQFLSGNLKRVLAGAGAALALGVVFVGGKVLAESKDDPEGSLEA